MTFRDVRMQGFERRVRLEVVRDWLDAQTPPLGSEPVSLADAAGRVLAADVTASAPVPAFRRSAMDGYAVRGEETTGAGAYAPLTFRLIGESFPGAPANVAVDPGQAVRIMTGAPVPDGADAVLPAEFATEQGELVEISDSVPPGKNVGRIGEDIAAGTTVLSTGRRLRPQDVGVLASLGAGAIDVVRRPRVRLLITGNELSPAGKPKPPHAIYDSNSWMLQALVQRDGGELSARQHLADDRDAIAAALSAPGADLILVSGGSSVGAEDHAPSLLAELGEIAYHGIAMRPASPAGVGRLGDALVFLLPGNPVSCLCAYDLLAGPALRRLGGRSGRLPYVTRPGVTARKIVSAIGRLDYCRVQLEDDSVTPIATSGASVLSSTTRADGFVLVPEECEGYAEGDRVDVYLYDLPFDRLSDECPG